MLQFGPRTLGAWIRRFGSPNAALLVRGPVFVA